MDAGSGRRKEGHMSEISVEQIRYFRLKAHHLDRAYEKEEAAELAGACGMQNSPPGAWETTFYNRAPGCSQAEAAHLLYKEKSLLQAWSFRGAPVVFPVSKSSTFLSALIPEKQESWIYTKGISLALDFLEMSFESVFEILKQVMPLLDRTVIVSKSELDQTIAGWMTPLIPASKRDLWNQPSMYGRPDIQTVGGAVVSFLLRPASFSGLVVFGERNGISPSFTSYRNWTGDILKPDEDASKQLVRQYLHCYGPATADSFVNWLGCSGRQGRRLFESISEELESVPFLGQTAFILSDDKRRLQYSGDPQRELLLLGSHDPFLDQRDRLVLQPDKTLHRQIWRLTANPGCIVYRGEIIGIWTEKKKSKGMEMKMSLWKDPVGKQKLQALAEEYAVFRQQRLIHILFG